MACGVRKYNARARAVSGINLVTAVPTRLRGWGREEKYIILLCISHHFIIYYIINHLRFTTFRFLAGFPTAFRSPAGYPTRVYYIRCLPALKEEMRMYTRLQMKTCFRVAIETSLKWKGDMPLK